MLRQLSKLIKLYFYPLSVIILLLLHYLAIYSRRYFKKENLSAQPAKPYSCRTWKGSSKTDFRDNRRSTLLFTIPDLIYYIKLSSRVWAHDGWIVETIFCILISIKLFEKTDFQTKVKSKCCIVIIHLFIYFFLIFS